MTSASKFTLLFFFLMPIFLLAQSKKQYFDGPYIFQLKDSLQVKWVERGVAYDTLILKTEATIFKRDSLPIVDLQNLDFKKEKRSNFKNVAKIVALSDLHGQYDILIQLLKKHQVIDENGHWKYGAGHFVITGDNFDRGDKVTEILWFLFYLQKEAEAAGGKVHVLLGNHEVMVLKGDLRYLNRKYLYTQGIFKQQYHHFFKEGSVLGDWIANHNVVTSINQRMFLHGGISPVILNLDITLQDINTIFRNQIIREKISEINKDEKLQILLRRNGPLWYRGYFGVNRLDIEAIDVILERFKQQAIVVGHTSAQKITPHFNNKVIAIDCSMKNGATGQVLLIEDEGLFIGEFDGKRTFLFKNELAVKKSFFEYLYRLESKPKLVLNTNTNQLLKKKEKEAYQPANLKVYDKNETALLDIDVRTRARGNMRKKVCRIPPIKIDIPKETLESLDLDLEVDKLKFVFPCNAGKGFQEILFKEYFLYQLYDLLDDNGMRVKLVDVVVFNEEKEKFNWVAILIEDEDEYARRQNARMLEGSKLRASRLERESFLKMVFFQYMIANVDWSIKNKHNIELVKLPDVKKVIAVPYDFDYSGFVGTDYAVPAPTLPIQNVHERFFFPTNKMSEQEFNRMVKYFLSIEQDIYKLCDEATYMKPKTIEGNKKYLASFFRLLKKPERIKSNFVK